MQYLELERTNDEPISMNIDSIVDNKASNNNINLDTWTVQYDTYLEYHIIK